MPLPSDIYDREYFLSDKCEGFDRFDADLGVSALKERELALMDVRAGHSVLDAGCGRGEVLLACATRGAQVTGIDYAEAAVEIARQTLAGVEGAVILRGDVTDLPFEDSSFDRILFGDVIEHIDVDQTPLALRELRRVLKPGGRLVVHTAPNLLFINLGWPVARLALKGLGHGESVRSLDVWIEESKEFHVNEQSVFSLRRSLRSTGFANVETWIDKDILRSGQHHLTEGLAPESKTIQTAARIIGTKPFRTIFGNDVYATASKTR